MSAGAPPKTETLLTVVLILRMLAYVHFTRNGNYGYVAKRSK